MKVVFVQRVEGVGEKGDEKEVKPGFARNFLLPRGLALSAESAEAKVIIANKEKDREQKTEKLKTVRKVLSRDQELVVSFKRKTEGKKLFAGIRPNEIIKEIEKKIGIIAKKIEPNKAIKEIGESKISAIFPDGEKKDVVVRIETAKDKKSGK